MERQSLDVSDEVWSVLVRFSSLPHSDQMYALPILGDVIDRLTAPPHPILPVDVWELILYPFTTPADFTSIRLVNKGWMEGVTKGVKKLTISNKLTNSPATLSLFHHITHLTLPLYPLIDLSQYYPNLSHLSIAPSDISPPAPGWGVISKLTNLISLSLDCNNITLTATEFSPLTKLKCLSLRMNSAMTGSSFRSLSIERLSLLECTMVANDDLRYLTSLHTLEIIGCGMGFSGEYINRRGVKSIPNLKKVITNRGDIMGVVECGVYVQGEIGTDTYYKYEGEWKDDNPHGWGTLTARDGVYEGEWVRGEKYGRGTTRYTNGDVYEGEWAKGEKHGKGIMRYINGNVYEGEWDNGWQHGIGKLTTKDKIIMGVWKGGRLVEEIGEGEGEG